MPDLFLLPGSASVGGYSARKTVTIIFYGRKMWYKNNVWIKGIFY